MDKYKETALNGIKELELFQIQSPFQDERTPEEVLKKWADKVRNSDSLNEIVKLGQDILVSKIKSNI